MQVPNSKLTLDDRCFIAKSASVQQFGEREPNSIANRANGTIVSTQSLTILIGALSSKSLNPGFRVLDRSHFFDDY